jgi:hypothetical protein
LITDEGIRGSGLNISITNTEEAIQVDGLEGNDTFFIQSTRTGAVTQVIGGLGADTFNVGGDVDLEIKSVDVAGRTGVISHDADSDDTDYSTTLIAGLGTTVSDETTGIVRLIQDAVTDATPGTARVTEANGGSTDVYSVVLTSAPPVGVPVYVTVSANRSSASDRDIAVPVMSGTPNLTLDNATQTITRSTGSWITDGFDAYMSLTLGGAAGDNVGNYVIVSVTDTEIVVEGTTPFAQELTAEAGITVTGQIASSLQVSADGTTFNDAIVLTFTSDTWNTAQEVTFKATDDAAAEGVRNVQIAHAVSSTSDAFNAARVENLVVTVDDDDKAGITVTPTGDGTLVLEGTAVTEVTDSYTVQLTRPPASGETITITLGGDTDSDLVLTNASGDPITELTFTASNWSDPQVVNVQAATGDGAEDVERVALTHTVTSNLNTGEYAEAITDQVNPIDQTLSITVLDGESAGVLVRETDGDTIVSTAGDTDTYTIRLTSAPTADVVLTIVDDGQTQVIADSRVSIIPVASATATVANAFTFDAIADAPDTITRTTGTWFDDNFAAGQAIDITGTADNNGAFQIASISEDGMTITLTGNAKLIDELKMCGRLGQVSPFNSETTNDNEDN